MQYPSKSQDLTPHPSQSGRTMVEIIGALAIMGVLSIASFAVYRLAIDWYRANEITHGIMERSVIVRQQRDLDAELNLKEFHPDTDKDYIMGHEVTLDIYDHEAAGLTQADSMTVHDVSNTVCRRIVGVTGWDNMILFVNDVETDPENTVASMDLCRAEEANDLTFAFWDGETIDVEEPGPGIDPEAKKDCGSDGTTLYRHGDDYEDCGKCDNGTLVSRSVSIPECQKCGSGTNWKLVNNDNVSCGTNKVCQSGACTCKIGTMPKTGTADTCVECNTNDDCKDASKPVCNTSGVCEESLCWDNNNCNEGYFCGYTQGTVRSDTGPTQQGRCKLVSEHRSGSGNGFIWSDTRMDWWTAQNFCLAQSKDLVSISDLNCPYTAGQYDTALHDHWGPSHVYCCATDNGLGSSAFEAPCNINSSTGYYDLAYSVPTSLLTASRLYYTRDISVMYPSGAFILRPGDSQLTIAARATSPTSIGALCK